MWQNEKRVKPVFFALFLSLTLVFAARHAFHKLLTITRQLLVGAVKSTVHSNAFRF